MEIEKLIMWIEEQIEFHQAQAIEFLGIEELSGPERYSSSGQYNQVIAYKRVVQFIKSNACELAGGAKSED